MYGPVLRGKLVTLRPPKMEEAALFVTWFADPEVTRTLTLRFPPSLDAEEKWLRDIADDRNHVFWVIEYEGRPVGTTGIMQIDWPNLHGITGTSIGEKSLWGRGIGSETMQLRTRYAFTELPLRKLTAAYIDGNEPSWKAQQKAGYRQVGRQREHVFRGGRWLDHIVTEVLREDWLRLQESS